MLVLNKARWVERVITVLDEPYPIRLAVRSPGRDILDALGEVYKEAALQVPEEGKQRTPEEMAMLMELTEKIQNVLSPEAVSTLIDNWDGIGHQNDEGDEVATPYSRENLQKAFVQFPILYNVAVEAVQAVVPQQKEEDEKNLNSSPDGATAEANQVRAVPRTAKLAESDKEPEKRH
jgi:hypothetical protein